MSIKARKFGKAYNVNLNFDDTLDYHKFGYANAILDTGCTVSAIAIECFGIKEAKSIMWESALKDKTRDDVDTAMNGAKINAYIACIPNVYIGDVLFKKYYFKLLVDSGWRCALLGYDLIDKCSLSHAIGGDIIINAINTDAYYKYWEEQTEGKNLVTINDIADIYNIDKIMIRNKPDMNSILSQVAKLN